MQRILFFLLIGFVLAACGGEPGKKADEIGSVTQQTQNDIAAGMIAANPDGYYLKAIVGGEDWKASSMLRYEDPGNSFKEVKGENGDNYIMFQLSKKSWKPGQVRNLESAGEDKAIRLSWDKDLFKSTRGELKILSVTDEWVEGSFHCEASSKRSGQTLRITDGYFRVATK